MKAFANLAASTQDPNAVSLFSWWCGWMDSNQRLSARQADVLTHYTTTTYFKNDVFRTVMRTRVLPGWYLSCSNFGCFSAVMH